MSGFLGGFGAGQNSARGSQTVNPQNVFEAEMNMEGLQDIIRRMTDSCKAKCLNTKFTDSELSAGEAVCVDRCSAKFFATNLVIQEK